MLNMFTSLIQLCKCWQTVAAATGK